MRAAVALAVGERTPTVGPLPTQAWLSITLIECALCVGAETALGHETPCSLYPPPPCPCCEARYPSMSLVPSFFSRLFGLVA